jgi:3-deoxy-7-phosphoheptulonate synthase
MPVGFKNNTAGDISAAVNAVMAAKNSHTFLSVTEQGLGAIVVTKGNDTCHVILRGGTNGPNYEQQYLDQAAKLLEKNHLPIKVIVDCSHDNCHKDYTKQEVVIDYICQQLQNKSANIMGVMLESNLVAGKQALQTGKDLVYGQSITDGCVDWQETEVLLRKLAKSTQ